MCKNAAVKKEDASSSPRLIVRVINCILFILPCWSSLVLKNLTVVTLQKSLVRCLGLIFRNADK